jgi:predicted deacylase
MDSLLFQTTEEATHVIHELNVEEAPQGCVSKYWLELVKDGIGVPIRVPVLVARGRRAGPVLGITAAIHGNELNGIPLIQRLFRHLDTAQMRGTLVGLPVLNVPALLRNQRAFMDGADLNQIMPGKANGNVSEVYAYRLMNCIVSRFEYLVDVHTASFGRANSYYVRADMDAPITQRMAMLQNAQIIVHNPPSDGTLRGAAAAAGIHAITLEIGNPNSFQKSLIRSGQNGIRNLLAHLGIAPNMIEPPEYPPVLCRRSYWVYTDSGGILLVHPEVNAHVRQGEHIATLHTIFGDPIKKYFAPEDGIVIEKSVGPINQTGGRILHLGIL